MITPELSQSIAEQVEALGLDENTLSALRHQYPDFHFTYCMDDDLPNHTPALERRGFNLYLVDGREHCLRLTDRYETATGLVLAEVIED